MCSIKMSKIYIITTNAHIHEHTQALIKFNQSKYLISFSLSVSFEADKNVLVVLVIRLLLKQRNIA